MRKFLELQSIHSCINKAREGEMTFVLLGRDICAPLAIRAWVEARIATGKNQRGDHQIREALECAEIMEKERRMEELGINEQDIAETMPPRL